MANAPTIDKPSVVKEAPVEDVQKPLRSDTSFLDGMKRDPKLPDNVKKHKYWYGVLPAVGATRNGKTALENWTREDGPSLWTGKCEWFQNISIRGITFSAYTGSSQRGPQQDPSQAISYGIIKAGFVEDFTDEQVKEILFAADHHMVRSPADGKTPDRASIYRLIQVDGQWVHESQDPTFQTQVRTSYNPSTDRPVSDFVYFIKIKDEFQQQDLPSIMRNPLPSLSGK